MNEKAKTFSGGPCKRCRRTERYVSNRGCVYCIKVQATRWQSKLQPMKPTPKPETPEDLI